jgi:hypothetical protein
VIFAVLEWRWPITTEFKGLCRFLLLIFAVFVPKCPFYSMVLNSQDGGVGHLGKRRYTDAFVNFELGVFFLVSVPNFIKIR